MNHFRKIIVLGFLGIFTSDIGWSMDSNCDILGDNLSTEKNSSIESCERQCQDNKDCLGAVFISGWNRCFLKKKIVRKSNVTMYSAIKGQEIAKNFDFSGKDFIQHDKKNPEDCEKACQDETQCTGFTFIEGYRTCWIKSTSGKLKAKVFYCYVKQPT